MGFTCCSKYKEFEDQESKAACQFCYAHPNEKVLKTDYMKTLAKDKT